MEPLRMSWEDWQGVYTCMLRGISDHAEDQQVDTSMEVTEQISKIDLCEGIAMGWWVDEGFKIN